MTTAVSEEQRAMLERMAGTWDALAAERESLIEQSKRIADLEVIRPVHTGGPTQQPSDQAGDDSTAKRRHRIKSG